MLLSFDYLCTLFFFSQKAENNRLKKSLLTKIFFFFFFLLKMRLFLHKMGPVDQQIKLVLPYFESVGLQHYNDLKPFIEYSYDTNDIYKNID